MYWEVYIDRNGIQCQLKLGKNPDRIATKQMGWSDGKRIRIQLVFETEGHLKEILDDNEYAYLDSYKKALKNRMNDIADEQDVAATMEMRWGFEMRISTIKPDCIGVIAEVDDADDYDEFQRKYSGLEGAKNILLSTTAIIYGCGKDPGKTIMKWLKRLELEEED